MERAPYQNNGGRAYYIVCSSSLEGHSVDLLLAQVLPALYFKPGVQEPLLELRVCGTTLVVLLLMG